MGRQYLYIQMAKMEHALDECKILKKSDSSEEEIEVNSPQLKTTVKTIRGLADAVNQDEDFDDSGPGVYAAQLNRFCIETKPNLEKHIIEVMRQTATNREKKLSPNRTEESHECEVDSPLPIPAPPSIELDDSLSSLLRDIEATQLAIEQRQSLNLLDDKFDDDCVDVYAKLAEYESSKSITVLVTYRVEITKHTMSMNENFSKLMEELAVKHNIHTSQVLLSLNGNFIKSEDTPASFGLHIADILDFGISEVPEKVSDNEDSKNKLRLKVQSKNFRSKMDIVIKKDDPLSELMTEYARRINANLSDLVFKFDGDKIDPSLTAEDLDLEEDYCIDVSIKI